MILHKNYSVELIVNGKRVDLPNDFDLNLNTRVYNPETILTKTAEYSYSFNLPTTRNNCQIFGLANVLSVPSKFSKTYQAELNSDGKNIFGGTLRLTEVTKYNFKCNLIIIKVNTVEDIFGDSTLNMIDWKVEFDGIPTINAVNADKDSKYWFPLVSYGVFAKKPLNSFETYNSYTSIYDIDYTTKFYNSTFYPSLQVLEILKKCFEYKGYTVDGTAFTNHLLRNTYMSTNLANQQIPHFNLGKDIFGECDISIDFKNHYTYTRRGETTYPTAIGTILDLNYPYDCYESQNGYNFDEISSYNITGLNIRKSAMRGGSVMTSLATNSWSSTIAENKHTFMYSKEDGVITIPSDGLYKIELNATANVQTSSQYINGSTMKVVQKYSDRHGNYPETEINIGSSTNYSEWKPIEIQLVRNYDDDIELIKGNRSFWHKGSTPSLTNPTIVYTSYPHEETFRNSTNIDNAYPTKKISGSDPSARDAYYYPQDGDVFYYDPIVSDKFICGFSTYGGVASVMKNNYSWYLGNTTLNDVRTNSRGYVEAAYGDDGTTTTSNSNYLKNTCDGADNNSFSMSSNGLSMSGKICMMMYLKQNDRLSLHAITRAYNTLTSSDDYDTQTYPINIHCDLKIKAMSPYHSQQFFDDGYNYNSNSEFDDKLNLADFLNKETKISDFINDTIKSFNLSYNQNDKHITIDTQKRNSFSNGKYAVNIDDRVNKDTEDISMSRIEYPSSLSVKYAINTKEAGFYNSVPREKLNQDDWEDYGDKGYDKITLDQSGEKNDEENSLQNSYCWYEKFKIKIPLYGDVSEGRGGTYVSIIDSAATTYDATIPVIAESQYFIDRGNVEDYMTKDGYSLNRRFFFRNFNKLCDFDTVYSNYNGYEKVDLYIPTNKYENILMNYKNNQNNLLNEYFNIEQSVSSNYIEINCYLTADEFYLLKNGANVIYNSDVYEVCEIKKYSVTKSNMCTLKLIKK